MVKMTDSADIRAKLFADLSLIERALSGERLHSADLAEARAFCGGVAKLLDTPQFQWQLANRIPLGPMPVREYSIEEIEARMAGDLP